MKTRVTFVALQGVLCAVVLSIGQASLVAADSGVLRTDGQAAASPELARAPDRGPLDPALEVRIGRWWQARVDRDHQVLYELFEPAYRRDFTFSKFLQESAIRTRFDIVGHRLVRVEPTSPDRATVFVEIGTSLSQFGGPHLVTVAEPWVKVDGEWYKVHEPFKPPFPDKAPF